MIVARDISLSYEKNKYVLGHINFHIKDKEFIIISGSSGSGKSTLLKTIYGNLAISQGDLTVNGVDITKKEYQKTLDLRKNLGIVFQDYKLIQDYTIEENIAAPLRIREFDEDVISKQVSNLLQHVRLSHKAKSYPNELSGGEQQRISVARALGHNPNLILADEPTGNLDKYSANIVWKLLQNANEQLGITVVVVTHKLPDDLEVKYRQFHIEEGRINEIS
mgnify:FL=1